MPTVATIHTVASAEDRTSAPCHVPIVVEQEDAMSSQRDINMRIALACFIIVGIALYVLIRINI